MTSPDSNWRQTLRSQTPAILVETFSVVLAVLLALGINGWRERRAEAQLAADALAKLVTEVEGNRDRLTNILPQQRARAESLQSGIDAIEAGNEPGVNIGLIAEQLRSAAWETALLTDAARHMDFEVVSQLSDIYKLQEVVDASLNRMLASMTSADFADDERSLPALKAFVGSMVQLISLEEQLLDLYEEWLESAPSTTP